MVVVRMPVHVVGSSILGYREAAMKVRDGDSAGIDPRERDNPRFQRERFPRIRVSGSIPAVWNVDGKNG